MSRGPGGLRSPAAAAPTPAGRPEASKAATEGGPPCPAPGAQPGAGASWRAAGSARAAPLGARAEVAGPRGRSGAPTLTRTGPSASGQASVLPAQPWCNPLNAEFHLNRHRARLRDAGTSTPHHGHFRNFPPSQTEIPTHPTLTTPLSPSPWFLAHPTLRPGSRDPEQPSVPGWKLGDAPRTPSRKHPLSHQGTWGPRSLASSRVTTGTGGDASEHFPKERQPSIQHPGPRADPRAGRRRLQPGPCFWPAQGRGGSASAVMPACLGEPVRLPVL